ncbi:MAG: sugar transferase [Proteobacteria bacterium]|nr:sugar transferase [Pseudomonadota bacterium]
MRRDLAAGSIVSYEPMLGGGRKRAFDLAVVVALLPFWLPALLGAALWSKFTTSAPVFGMKRCVGYGGRSFNRLRLQLAKSPTAEASAADEVLETSQVKSTEAQPQAKWMHAFERLPELVNVLRGDMSLVGPSPLPQENLDQLKSGRRYYLSARPGVFGISRLVDRAHAESQHKAYALSWSLMLDLQIIWDRVHGFRNRGRLWQPGLRLNRVVPGLALEERREIVVRKRSAP